MLDFWAGKRVLITGHSGFKGSWLTKVLDEAGSITLGYALAPENGPNLHSLLSFSGRHTSIYGDVRDHQKFATAISDFAPEVVFHLAAQPLVLDGYKDPLYTYETNVLGSLYLLESLRSICSARSVVIITTDKVYANDGRVGSYRESDALDGYDPYANSKSCSELITRCYERSFFAGSKTAVSTARSGNVIGGGDFAAHRIIVDCVAAALQNRPIEVRNPSSTRPYQYVLESISAYLAIAERQYSDAGLAGSYNVGPNQNDIVTTRTLVEKFCAEWGAGTSWEHIPVSGPHEDHLLALDNSLICKNIGWRPWWTIEDALIHTVRWSKAHSSGANMNEFTAHQIQHYFEERAR